MKKLFPICLLVLNLHWAFGAQAKISEDTFDAKEPVTAGKLFLNQVDAVSLYLTTERIVYVPRLTQEKGLDISVTLIGASFTNDPAALQSFITRHIHTFNKTLMERLAFHTPALAKEFDPDKDIQFVIKVGAQKKTVATWREGVWSWVKAGKEATQTLTPSVLSVPAAPAAMISPVLENEGKNCKKKCPALIDSAKAEEPSAPSAEAEPQEIPAQLSSTDSAKGVAEETDSEQPQSAPKASRLNGVGQ